MKTIALPVPKIIEAPEKKLVGMKLTVSLVDMKTRALWQSFGPKRKAIKHRTDQGSYSVQVYGDDFLETPLLPDTPFEKWAAVAVTTYADIPEGMDTLTIEAGLWAVFSYKGVAAHMALFMQGIFLKWLPQSGFKLRNAPQYEYMPPDYLGPMHPEAEEEVWIPIKYTVV